MADSPHRTFIKTETKLKIIKLERKRYPESFFVVCLPQITRKDAGGIKRL
jgi:hypothetical protein